MAEMKKEQKKTISSRSKSLWQDPTKDENGLTYADRVKAGIKAKAAKKRETKTTEDKKVEDRVTKKTTIKLTVVDSLPEEINTEKKEVIDKINKIKPHQGKKPLEDFKKEELDKHLDCLEKGKEEKTTYNFGGVEVTDEDLNG